MALIFRKLYRLTAIIFPLLYQFTNRKITLIFTGGLLGIFIVIEVLRIFSPRLNEKIFVFFKSITKEKEKKAFLGTTYFLASVFLSIFLFSKEIAITVMYFLIFGDALAALVGNYLGKIKIKTKTLEGSLCFFWICLLIGFFLLPHFFSLSWRSIFFGALTATLVELLPLALDDNFTIAISSGIVMSLV